MSDREQRFIDREEYDFNKREDNYYGLHINMLDNTFLQYFVLVIKYYGIVLMVLTAIIAIFHFNECIRALKIEMTIWVVNYIVSRVFHIKY